MDPISLGIGGVLSLAGMAYSAIKGGQAMKANDRLLNQQEAENKAWYNNNRNYCYKYFSFHAYSFLYTRRATK